MLAGLYSIRSTSQGSKQMAIAYPPTTKPLTYDEYMAEGEINRRYDIVEGVRQFMPGPIWAHQRRVGDAFAILRRFELASGIGYALVAPLDLVIKRNPLQTRQPDALFITLETLSKAGGPPEKGALE